MANATSLKATEESLTKGEHLLLRMRGDGTWWHAVVVEPNDGVLVWVLTPNRYLEKFDFTAWGLCEAKMWDDVALPASVRGESTALATASARGVFTAGDLARPPWLRCGSSRRTPLAARGFSYPAPR